MAGSAGVSWGKRGRSKGLAGVRGLNRRQAGPPMVLNLMGRAGIGAPRPSPEESMVTGRRSAGSGPWDRPGHTCRASPEDPSGFPFLLSLTGYETGKSSHTTRAKSLTPLDPQFSPSVKWGS